MRKKDEGDFDSVELVMSISLAADQMGSFQKEEDDSVPAVRLYLFSDGGRPVGQCVRAQ